MLSFSATLVGFVLFVLALGLGAMLRGRPLRGSRGFSSGDCICSRAEARDCARGYAGREKTVGGGAQ